MMVLRFWADTFGFSGGENIRESIKSNNVILLSVFLPCKVIFIKGKYQNSAQSSFCHYFLKSSSHFKAKNVSISIKHLERRT